MRIPILPTLLAGVLAFSPFVSRAADPAPLAPAQVEAVETIVHDYIVAHPEVLVEAAQALQEKEEVAHTAHARAAIGKLRPELERNPKTPVLGNPNGDVTVVEFFDYNCGYCKLVFTSLMKVIAEDGNVRLALKELPILGPESLVAAKAALAANAQGKYQDFFTAAMGHRGKFDDSELDEIAKSIGLDRLRLTKDMADAGIEKILEQNRDLARSLDINGTPAFIVGDTLVAGALNEKTLKEMIADTRKAAKAAH